MSSTESFYFYLGWIVSLVVSKEQKSVWNVVLLSSFNSISGPSMWCIDYRSKCRIHHSRAREARVFSSSIWQRANWLPCAFITPIHTTPSLHKRKRKESISFSLIFIYPRKQKGRGPNKDMGSICITKKTQDTGWSHSFNYTKRKSGMEHFSVRLRWMHWYFMKLLTAKSSVVFKRFWTDPTRLKLKVISRTCFV